MPGQTWRDNGHKALCPLSCLGLSLGKLRVRTTFTLAGDRQTKSSQVVMHLHG
eukprot:COSAG02_NODE_21051_length_804_cov_241.048227_1_plen_52_part_10